MSFGVPSDCLQWTIPVADTVDIGCQLAGNLGWYPENRGAIRFAAGSLEDEPEGPGMGAEAEDVVVGTDAGEEPM